MLDHYEVPRCGDVAHRINELGQMYRRARAALGELGNPSLPSEAELRHLRSVVRQLAHALENATYGVARVPVAGEREP
jgi:hypothetical protein